ncbi:MAG TPA: zinc-ribbon domain-containing protein [Polyangiaceae bacterium]|nr:zinc-ribbon domain-containing protein [Polyangiaceae bacterium]
MNQPDLWKMLRWVLPLGAALASVVVGVSLGIEIGILVLAGAVLLGVIFILWNSVQGLTGEAELTLEEALSLAAPSAEEEEKRAVLRTLKDLEYEKSVGKISDEDYAELVTKYTARAKELIQAVDVDMGDARAQVERLIAKRMEEEASASKLRSRKAKRTTDSRKRERARDASDTLQTSDASPAVAPDSAPAQESTPRPKTAAASGIECPECTTENDPDARFCKSCGTPLEEAS